MRGGSGRAGDSGDETSCLRLCVAIGVEIGVCTADGGAEGIAVGMLRLG